MDHLPTEVWNQILGFLVDDGISIVRLSTCSQSLHQYITTNQFLWKKIGKNRWKFPLLQDQDSDDFRLEYQRRHKLDAGARDLLHEMTGDLGAMLEYEAGKKLSTESPLIGQGWEHPRWQEILSFRTELFDVMLEEARRSDKDNQLYPFLAARCLQTIHLAECLYNWMTLMQSAGRNSDYDPKEDALLLERFALLAVQIQQTPRELMEEPNVTAQVCQKLDAIANKCRERFTDNDNMTKLDKLQVVNQILFQEYGLQGNSQDYYNYRNSLLNHVLESKKGIPMTLCIIYTLICRRLDLVVYLVGLPGHVVLGVGDNDYYDPFNHGGDGQGLLSVADCQRIVARYSGWSDEFLRPLQAVDALHRILNNLANAHTHHLHNPPEFHPDVWFQQRALMLLHRTDPSASLEVLGHTSREEVLGHISRELPLVLSVDLFRFYNLLD
jgi:regulator of sirC expression with transglutaminase-like and TPR domain